MMKIDQAIQGRRIVIRNYEKSDLDFLTGMWFDAENGKYMSDPTEAYVDAAFQKALDTLGESELGYYLVIQLAQTKEPVGSFSVFPDADKKVYDIGYCIHKAHWKRGYGSEALSLMLDWISAQGAEKVTAEVAVDNLASNALLRKFGFTVEKKTAFQKYNMDVRYDSYIYARTLENRMVVPIEQILYDTAVSFIKERYPTQWGGAAVIHTEDDRYFISVAPEVLNASAELCIETGAICEAHKFNVRVTHCICVVRDDENSPFKVLTPCGICQERLRYWGEDVKVGVTTRDHSLRFVRLGELMPYYWGKAYDEAN